MKSRILSTIMVLFFLGLKAQKKQDETLQFSMETRWTDQVKEKSPWDHYPRPQMVRGNWQNLNGLWEYAIRPKGESVPNKFDGDILVPFAVESELSQVKKLVGEDNYLWYRTYIDPAKVDKDEKLHLNFGAVDWEAVVFVNGEVAGGHKGGYTPFTVDITPYLNEGPQEIVVRVWDPTDKGTQPRGKQVQKPGGIWYTPVTGIWQTVWLERVPDNHIQQIKTTPDIERSLAKVEVKTGQLNEQFTLKVTVSELGKPVAVKEIEVSPTGSKTGFELDIPQMKLWSPENPFLYDMKISLLDQEGAVIDEVESYFGMRKVSLGKDANGYTRIMLNNKPYFQFGLLDQGWWPDGLYTAPTEAAMLYDVKMTQRMGFNMLRKHVKVEPARFYYHCDKMGILVWQDMPNGNYFRDLRIQAWEQQDAKRSFNSSLQFEAELKEMMDYFHSFPSIVVWVPFNEGWGQYDTKRITEWVSAYDPSRLVDSPSGWTDRGVGDIVDTHIYPGPGIEAPEAERASVIGEFGGLGLIIEDHLWWDKKNWGYLTYNDKTKFETRFKQLIDDLVGLKSFGLSAAIYTQTTDVEGEVNGLLTYDREVVKVDPAKTSQIFARLYEPAGTKVTLLEDAEIQPALWKVSQLEQKDKDWILNEFDDRTWRQRSAPFSSFDNYFLPEGSFWSEDESLFLRRSFQVRDVPSEIELKYYLNKADMKVYINGEIVASEKFRGGRKRHYRNKRIHDAHEFLRKGKNIIAVEVEGKHKEKSFDLGIYSIKALENASLAVPDGPKESALTGAE